MKLNKNVTMLKNEGNESGIDETPIELKSKEWKDTGEVWKKNCPKCGKEIFYKTKYIRNVSIKKNLICVSCNQKHRVRCKLKPKIKFICKICQKEVEVKHNVKNKEVCRKCRSKCSLFRTCPDCGKKIEYTTKWRYEKSCENNIKCSRCRQLNIPHNIPYRRPHSEEAKAKMRQTYIKNGNVYPNYNRTACLYFEWLNKWNGWKGQYALNPEEKYVEELGYWVDYYEPKHNIVIEWDEKKHFNTDGSLKEKDVNRMKRIKTLLGCRFFRYNERTGKLKEYE
jgi:hypothetical protein